MALPQGKIVDVVRGGYLDRPGTELAADPAVGHDGNLAAGEGQVKHLSPQAGVSFVVGVNGDRDIAQHGLGTGRRDGDERGLSHHRVANLP